MRSFGLLAGFAAAVLLSGCSAPAPQYPQEWTQPVAAADACAALAGTYRNQGEAPYVERLPNNTPYLTDFLLGSSGPSGVDRIDLALADDHTLIIRGRYVAAIVSEVRVPVASSIDGCALPGNGWQTRAVTLQKTTDGTLVAHVAAQSLLYMAVPAQFAEARWARFAPAN